MTTDKIVPLTMKLVKLSICDCGHNALHDEITLGTEYIIYPESKGDIHCNWTCGGCGKTITHVEMVQASSVINKDYVNWLPSELFFQENA